MGRIPQRIIEDVLMHTDIVQIVQQYVHLKRAGINHKGLCPFHEEKTPSFNVHAARGTYKCFGCHEGGNVIDFLIKIEGWSFPETIRHLAERLGLDIPEEHEEDAKKARKRREAKRSYVDLMGNARTFYEDQLWSNAGMKARTYMQDRGVDDETARSFGVGYAPAGWKNLLDYMRVSGINGAQLERAGMAISRSDSDGCYDRFRDRIMFPVIDNVGNTLAFGGRVLPGDDGPKYINSSETPFYTKGRNLFGLFNAKKGIQRAGYALLVEGNFDVITLHARGMNMTIAPMGTAFTEDQAKLLKRFTKDVFIAFDGDSAGEQATLKCLSAMERSGLKARVVRFEEGDDPDTFVRREGVDALSSKLNHAPSLVSWAIDRVMPMDHNVAIEERIKALQSAAEILHEVRDKIVWDTYAKELIRRLDIEPKQFRQYLRRPSEVQEELKEQWSQEKSAKMTLEADELMLLILLLDHPEWLAHFEHEEMGNLLKSVELSGFIAQAHSYYQEHKRLDIPILLMQVHHKGFEKTVTQAASISGSQFNDLELYDTEKAEKIYKDVLRKLKVRWATRSLDELIPKSEKLGRDYAKNREEYAQIMNQIQQLEQFRAMHINTSKSA